MGPKTASSAGAAFQKKVDDLFTFEEPEAPEEKEDADTGDKNSEDE